MRRCQKDRRGRPSEKTARASTALSRVRLPLHPSRSPVPNQNIQALQSSGELHSAFRIRGSPRLRARSAHAQIARALIDAALAAGSASPYARSTEDVVAEETPVTPRLYIGTGDCPSLGTRTTRRDLRRVSGASGMYSETRVWGLASHPRRPNELLAADAASIGWTFPAAKLTQLPSKMDCSASGRSRARRTTQI